MKLRAAIIGCGKIGTEFADDPRAPGIYSHAGAYVSFPDTALAAVCDLDPKRAEACARRWGLAHSYSSLAELLEREQPEIVSVCTPDATHAEVIRLLLKSSSVKGILAEKPLATDLNSARDIVDMANSRGIALLVNYSRRFDAGHREVREHIQSGELGKIQSVTGRYTKGTIHNGSHWFDLLRFLCGDIKRVWAINNGRENGAEDPTMDAVLELASGCLCHLSACDSTAFSIFEMDIIGTLGRIEITDSGHRISYADVQESAHYSGYKNLVAPRVIENPMRDLLLHAVEDLVHCVRLGCKTTCSGSDGVEALKIALAIQRSVKTETWVKVADE